MSLWGIALHAILLALLFAAAFGLFQKKREGIRSRPRLWLLVIAIVTAFGVIGRNFEGGDHIYGYVVLVWIVAGAAFLTSLPALASGRQPSVGLVLGSLGGIGVLILGLLPQVPSAREAARRTQCKNNLKQIGQALYEWNEKHGRLVDSNMAAPGEPALSWRVAILDHLEQSDLAKRYDRSKPWDNPANLTTAHDEHFVYLCPSIRSSGPDPVPKVGAYSLITGPGTAFPDGKGIALREIRDGAQQTILAGEASGLQIFWTEPRDVDVARETLSVNQDGETPDRSPSILSSFHEHGAQVVLGDGTVRFISDSIDPTVLKAVTTAAGGESLDDF